MTGFHREQHAITRVDISTGVAFDEFVAAFEKAAPPFDLAATERIVAAGGDWDEVRAAAAKNAPNELIMYARSSTRPSCWVLPAIAPGRSSTWSATM